MPNVVEDMLPVVNTPVGTAVNITTIQGIKYSAGVTLAQGLDVMSVQITESAAGVAQLAEKVAALETWLTTHFDYQPVPASPTPGTYLSPLFAQLMQVPSGGAKA